MVAPIAALVSLPQNAARVPCPRLPIFETIFVFMFGYATINHINSNTGERNPGTVLERVISVLETFLVHFEHFSLQTQVALTHCRDTSVHH